MKKRDYTRDNERRRRQKRKVLPGFPWEGQFQTKEEVDAYFAGEKIQCLLCGKWYVAINHNHLEKIHDMTINEYRERYGLPWGRGLISEQYHKTRSAIIKRRIADGSLQPPDLRTEQMRRKSQASPQRPSQPFAQDIKRRQVQATARKRRAQTRIEDMRQLAERRGGTCLSAAYVTNKTKLVWQCAKGHQWEAPPAQIKRGTWCPVCAKQKQAETSRLGIEAMQQLAACRGGKCLSTTYVNSLAKLEWQCAEGHRWKVRPSNIKRGDWCPVCAQQRLRLGIEAMQQLAARRGGKCLSTTYINNKTKLRWQCAEGHQWESVPNSIMKGRWCPVCARLKRKK